MKTPIFFIALIALLSSACLRYVPAVNPNTDKTNDGKEILSGNELFFKKQKENQTRLTTLVEMRKASGLPKKDRDYHIGPDDLLEINVFDIPELNTTVRVRPSGFINLPLIGAVVAAGRSEEQLQNDLTLRLTKFVKDPQVRVFITEYAANTIHLLGRVMNPGKVPIKRDGYSLLAVLSQAGIKSEQPIGPIAIIPAQPGNKEPASGTQTIELWYDDLIGGRSGLPTDVPLLPGDVVIVKDPATVIVDGEVTKIGPMEPTSKPTLLTAIASAQGVTYSANVHQVEVLRLLDDGQKALHIVDLEKVLNREENDFRLQDGDIIRVPSQGARFITRQMVDSINRFVSFTVGGRYDVAQ
ncbi:MAG: polysaccharide biosynthesis/export family protein [Deltaproteobacteria bacterium]|nr:polysaccharide biosynthesis/export family protein [Deltaproteobacteria bacterium]